MNDPASAIAEQLSSALALHQQGQLSLAQGIYEAILRTHPGHAEALHLLGLIAYQRKELGKALELIGRAIAMRPESAAFHLNRGIVLHELKQFDAAIADYGKTIAIMPDHAEAHNNRGVALRELKQLEPALADYDKAIALRPDYAAAYNNRGNLLQELKQPEAAIADYNRAIAIKPDYAEAYNNRGNALQQLQKLDAAMADYAKAISLKPDYAEAYQNRAMALRELRKVEAAIADLDTAIAIKPDFADAYKNRGAVLQDMRQLDAAITDFDKAIALRPAYAEAYWNKALALLLRGDYETGFKLYEWRWQLPQFHSEPRSFAQPLWLGDGPLRNKTLLLHSEQGLGDTIQFCRYAPLAAQAGAEVILEVPPQLRALLQDLPGVKRVLARGEALPGFDCHCPLLSLPLAFRTVLGTIPDPTPYLAAEPAKTRAWQKRIGDSPKPRVGVVWSGGSRPIADKGRAIAERRNIRLDMFAGALNGIDAVFFSLQKGDPAETEIRGREREYWPRGNFHNFASEIKDFTDTAALIANLDLVVSVDTSTAHLAAALGKPTWILNRYDTDWRWLLDRDDSPWYRSVKLYRQDESRSWKPVLRRVAADLTQRAREHRAGRP